MGVNSLPKTVTRQRRDCDLNPGPSAPESSTLTTRLPSHPLTEVAGKYCSERFPWSYIWRRAYINKPAIGSVNRCRIRQLTDSRTRVAHGRRCSCVH